MKRQTSQLLTAPAGTGKSYMMVWELVRGFLPNQDGDCWSNMPFGLVPEHHAFPPDYLGETFVDRIADYVAKRSKRHADEVRQRVKLFDEQTLATWSAGESGPWEIFENENIDGALIILDEAHNFAGKRHDNDHIKRWQQFCGELRHRGASIQFVTQHPFKLHPSIRHECGLRQALIDAEEERDPFLKIKLAYWYELKAKLLGKYESCFVRVDLRDVDGKKEKHSHAVRVTRDPEIFRLYDSFSAPHAGGASGTAPAKREFERRSWPSLLWWFFAANAANFVRPTMFVVGLVVFVLYGGAMFRGFTKWVGNAAMSKKAAAETEPTLAEVWTPDVPAMPDVPVVHSILKEPAADAIAHVVGELAERWELRVLTPHAATFADGLVVRPGQVITEDGPYEGLQIDRIDWPSRSVVFVDGDFIRLGGLRWAEASQPAETPAALSNGAAVVDGERPYETRNWTLDDEQRAARARAFLPTGGGADGSLDRR